MNSVATRSRHGCGIAAAPPAAFAIQTPLHQAFHVVRKLSSRALRNSSASPSVRAAHRLSPRAGRFPFQFARRSGRHIDLRPPSQVAKLVAGESAIGQHLLRRGCAVHSSTTAARGTSQRWEDRCPRSNDFLTRSRREPTRNRALRRKPSSPLAPRQLGLATWRRRCKRCGISAAPFQFSTFTASRAVLGSLVTRLCQRRISAAILARPWQARLGVNPIPRGAGRCESRVSGTVTTVQPQLTRISNLVNRSSRPPSAAKCNQRQLFPPAHPQIAQLEVFRIRAPDDAI